MNIKDKVVFIADKGFFSADNIVGMEKERLSYIIPLQHNDFKKKCVILFSRAELFGIMPIKKRITS